jgi:hypothetical protein
MRFYIALILLLGFHSSFAAPASTEGNQTHALMSPEEEEIHQRAKKKLYPGGRDEDPLKVQSQLPQANRKMGPATEAPQEEDSADSAHD